MSGSYVNNDSRSEKLNDAAAHDTGLYNPDTHDNQIVALYDTMSEANKARDMLVHAGVSSESIQVMDKSADTMAGGVDYEAGNQGMWGAIKSLFIPDEEAHAYNHAISKGHAMVVVSPARSANREAIIHTLESTNPIDFDAKLEEWRQAGYDYQGAGSQGASGNTLSATVNRAASTPANYAVNQRRNGQHRSDDGRQSDERNGGDAQHPSRGHVRCRRPHIQSGRRHRYDQGSGRALAGRQA